ncbi:MAG: aminotransferase class V-fold PLP-dependent enzyme [Saprospiraceae bacterium]|nr:aminotransferase class V-fold PLP-dependent enzyme [Saprospiraceae bacterium]
MKKRDFIKQTTLGTLALLPFIDSLQCLISKYEGVDSFSLARDEGFWTKIRGDYHLKPDYINLENGYYCFSPQPILDAFIGHIRRVNLEGSYYMRSTQFSDKKQVAGSIAELLGCNQESVIITRNTTESLDTIISAMNWEAGDEAVMAEQDYGAMLNQFKLMGIKHGIINKLISIPNHPDSDDEIVQLYASAITEKTKLLMVCHMINITGQILPVRKICDMAHQKGVEVLVDGAHAFAHIQYKMDELNCDYYGASLHKWLSAPLGSGLLYVRKEKIRKITPFFAPWNDDPDDIYKLNHTGTHPVYNDLAIMDAIAYYKLIGKERKETRLRYLQRYWYEQLSNIPGIILNTPSDPNRSCGIANVGIEGVTPSDLAKLLLEKYIIWTVAIDGAGVQGCRITPNIYTTPEELDQFVAAMKDINNNK